MTTEIKTEPTTVAETQTTSVKPAPLFAQNGLAVRTGIRAGSATTESRRK